MISLQYHHIPVFLHGSEFYLSLYREHGDSEDEVIPIPERCFKENDEVANLDDFGQLLHTMQFWGVDVIPAGMIQFLHHLPYTDWEPVATSVLDSKSHLLDDLISIYTPSRNALAQAIDIADRVRWIIRRNRSELLAYWLDKGWYKEQKGCHSIEMSDFAAACGSLKCLQILVSNNFPVSHQTVLLASKNGHLDCLRFLREKNCPCDSSVLVEAAAAGHIPILQYAHQQGLEWNNTVCSEAARNGQLPCLQYAHEHGCPWSSDIPLHAAAYGHYSCLKYALEHGCDVTNHASVCATHDDHLSCLQLLHEFNAPWDSSVSCTAAMQGHLHILQYLHEHHCPWDDRVFIEATQHGHLDCIQYAHSQGLELPTAGYYLCKLASRFGRLEILKYFHDHGVPWEADTVYEGVLREQLEIVQYAISRGCDWNWHSCTMQVCKNGDINMLRYLFSEIHPDQSDFCALAIRAIPSTNVLRCLVEEFHFHLGDKNHDSRRVFSAALISLDLSCIRYCFEKGCREVDYDTLCKLSIYHSTDNILLERLKYLVEQGWEIPYTLMQYVRRYKHTLSTCEAYCCSVYTRW